MDGRPSNTGERVTGDAELWGVDGDVPDATAAPAPYSGGMEPGRPLRDVFAELLDDESARQAYAADPGGFLGSYGHADLPEPLVAEAVVSFADTASPDVAEYLAPFVIANSAVPVDDASNDAQGLDVLAGAPIGIGEGALGGDDAAAIDESLGAGVDSPGPAPDAVHGQLLDLDFGGGTADAVPPADREIAQIDVEAEALTSPESGAADEPTEPELRELDITEYEPTDEPPDGDVVE